MNRDEGKGEGEIAIEVMKVVNSGYMYDFGNWPIFN